MSFWSSILPPENISTNGQIIDGLFNYVTWVDTFFFILVCIGLFGFSFLYSAKRNPKPYYTHGLKKVHLTVTMIISVLVFVTLDMNITRKSNDALLDEFWNYPQSDEQNVLRVQILAQQWGWNYRLAGEDNVFNTRDDIVTFNDLHVPADTKLLFHMTSKDVIHSFFISQARIKTDLIPGRVTRMWTELTKPGVYQVACAEMCGTAHYKMSSVMTVHTKEDFVKWQKEAGKIALAANDSEDYPDIFWGWKWGSN